jgi:hypothetical protein
MKPLSQTKNSLFFSDGTRLTYGNCLIACVASILDEPIDEVPNIYTFYGLGEKTDKIENQIWFEVLNKWLTLKHNKCLRVHEIGDEVVQPYVIMRGLSKRSRPHCVIYKNENNYLVPFFDPHPTKEYLAQEHFFLTIEECITSSL